MITVILFLLSILFSKTASQTVEPVIPQKPSLNILVRGFLEDKEPALAPDTDLLLQQNHRSLLIAISAIESQYCKRQLGWNCWGVGGDSAYRHYSSIRAAIVDANDLIEHWQEKGKWLTPETMNCSYVVPCNENWVRVVTKILAELDEYERQSTSTIYQQES